MFLKSALDDNCLYGKRIWGCDPVIRHCSLMFIYICMCFFNMGLFTFSVYFYHMCILSGDQLM